MASPDAYPHLTWSQASPGLWQRGIDEIEQFYSSLAILYEGSGRLFFAITGFASLSVDVQGLDAEAANQAVDQALEKAWLRLRYDHPDIASHVSLDVAKDEWTKSYTTFQNDNDRDAWIHKTLVPISNGQTGLEFANSDPPAFRLPTLFVVHPLQTNKDTISTTIRRDLVFRSPHDIIDGIGTLLLLNNLIRHTSAAFEQGQSWKEPVFNDSEAANLSPPYRIAANIPPQLTPEQKAHLDSVVAQKAQVSTATDIKKLSLPYRKGHVLPGKHQRAALTLSTSQTTQLLEAAKKASVTPTHLFHAAAAMVCRDIQPPFSTTSTTSTEGEKVRYISYILRNERANCTEPYNTDRHPTGLYHSVSGPSLIIDMDVPQNGSQPDANVRQDEFHAIVARMKAFYNQVRHDTAHAALVPDLWAIGTPKLDPTAPRPLPVPEPNLQPSVSISSMGRVDRIVSPKQGRVSVADAWVTGEELGTGLGLFLGTFRGRLCLSAAYNDAWHTIEDVQRFLERCKAIVFEGMSVFGSE